MQLPTPENDEVSTRLLWDAGDTNNFAENGGADSSMDFSMPNSSEKVNHSRQTSPELEHFISRMWQPNFDALGSGCLPDVALHSQGSYMHFSNMAYGSPGIPGQHELQLPRIKDDSGSTLHIPGMLSMPQQQQLPTSFAGNMPNASIDALSSPRSVPEMRNGAGFSSRSPNLSLSDSPRRSLPNNQQSSASSPGQNPASLESRFDHVIKAVDEAGFKSIDDMSAQYYTADFREDTAPFWVQSRSRSRSLPGLLAALHESTDTWPSRDIQSYKQQVANMAEDIYMGELATAKQNIGKEREMWHRQEAIPTGEQSDRIVENLWAAISDIECSQDLKEKRAMIRENVSMTYFHRVLEQELIQIRIQMPDLWSLLVELTRKADLGQPQGSQVAGAFLLLLGSCIS